MTSSLSLKIYLEKSVMASLSLNQVVSRTAKWSLSLLSTFLCNQSTETIQATLDASISPSLLGGTSVEPGNEKPRFQDSLPSSFPCHELLIRGKMFRSFNDPYFKFSVLSRVLMYLGVYENLLSNEFTRVK